MIAPRTVAVEMGGRRTHVEQLRALGWCGELLRERQCADERAAVGLDDPAEVRRLRRADRGGLGDERADVA